MLKQLKIKVVKDAVVFSGSIDAEHTFDFDATKIDIRLSDGGSLSFQHNPKFDSWFLTHNKKKADSPKYFETISTNEYGSSDEMIIHYEVANAVVCVNGIGLKMYGIQTLNKDQQLQYDILVDYLCARGFVCIDEIKQDLKKIITGTYIVK